MKYQIIVHNHQGASDAHAAEAKRDINTWLANWADPQNLTATVTDEDGRILARKDFGRKTLVWS